MTSQCDKPDEEMDRLADSAQQPLISELWQFILTNKAWWMLPILAVMLLLGALIALSTTGATPFIYAIF